MSIQYIRREQVQIAAPAALTGGALTYAPGGRPGVFHGMKSAAIGEQIALNQEGSYRIDKASGTVFEVGQQVAYNPTTGLAVTATVANIVAGAVPFGVATAAAASGQLFVDAVYGAQQHVWANDVSRPSVTASSTETVLGRITVPAAALGVGFGLEVVAGWTAPTTNSTDTFNFRLRLDTIAGSALWESGAVDLANGNTAQVRSSVSVLVNSAIGTVSAVNDGRIHTTNVDSVAVVASHDLTTALTIVATAQHSTTNGGNTSRLDLFRAVSIA